MKKLVLILVGLVIGFSGCASKENARYKDFQKSPCACFEVFSAKKASHV
jgi:hypothetical protein